METDPLNKVFNKYAKGEMNGRTFVKIFKDCKLVDSKLSTTGLDIIFSKVKTKGKLKITPAQFIKGVQLAAVEKKVDHQAMVDKLCSSKGPKFKGTKAQNVKLHDDKSSYTGVYAKGGPSNVDKGKSKITDLSQIANRSKADVRGVDQKILKKKRKEFKD